MTAPTVRTARKRWRCCNAHAAKVGNAPNCRINIQPGEQYVEGDIDPYLAGGFGHDKLCLGCEPLEAPAAQWTALPKAAELLASYAASPPAQRYARGTFGPHDGAMIYADDRVRELEAIWRAERDRLWGQCDPEQPFNKAADDFTAHCRNDVQSAISDRIATLGSAVESLSLEEMELVG